MKKVIIKIRQEIFKRIKEAEDLDTIHWYCAIDDCFENDEFNRDEFKNLKWRLQALTWKGENINGLVKMIEPVLQYEGLIPHPKKEVG